jgi:hypothetical protein
MIGADRERWMLVRGLFNVGVPGRFALVWMADFSWNSGRLRPESVAEIVGIGSLAVAVAL